MRLTNSREGALCRALDYYRRSLERSPCLHPIPMSDAKENVGGKNTEMANATADIGLIGLAVMGQNLILNMNDHGARRVSNPKPMTCLPCCCYIF